MFDISFAEMTLISVAILIVLGPERLPGVARTAGHLFGRLQRYVFEVKADINRELHLDELKKMQEEVVGAAQEIGAAAHKEYQSVRQSIDNLAHEAEEALPAKQLKTAETKQKKIAGSDQKQPEKTKQTKQTRKAPSSRQKKPVSNSPRNTAAVATNTHKS